MSKQTWQKCFIFQFVSIMILVIAFLCLTIIKVPLGKYHYLVSAVSGAFAASMLNFLKKDVPYFHKNKCLKFFYSLILKFFLGYSLIWVTFKITNDFPQDKFLFIGYCSFWFWLANILTAEIINFKNNENKLNHEESVFLLDFINHYREDFNDNFHAKNEQISKKLKPLQDRTEHKILSSIEDKLTLNSSK